MKSKQATFTFVIALMLTALCAGSGVLSEESTLPHSTESGSPKADNVLVGVDSLTYEVLNVAGNLTSSQEHYRSLLAGRHVFSSGGGARQIGEYSVNSCFGQPATGFSGIGNFDIGSGVLDEPEFPLPCGDANGSEFVDIDDIIYLIDFMFNGGPSPEPYDIGDVNCTAFIDIDDIILLIDYTFTGGRAPCDPDNDGEPDC